MASASVSAEPQDGVTDGGFAPVPVPDVAVAVAGAVVLSYSPAGIWRIVQPARSEFVHDSVIVVESPSTIFR